MRFFSKPGVFTPHQSHRTVVLASVQLASFHRRGAAVAIDFLLFALLWIPLKISIPYFVEHRLHISDEAHPLKVWHGHISVKYEPEQTLELVWTFCLVIYFGSFLRIANGFTPGKRLMRIRVVSLTHAASALGRPWSGRWAMAHRYSKAASVSFSIFCTTITSAHMTGWLKPL